MTRARTFIPPPRTCVMGIFLLALLIGCATEPNAQKEASPHPVESVEPVAQVVRAGRYSLVEVGADEAQRDLLQQLVEVSAPIAMPATVADMLHYVLLRSGYSMCAGDALARFEALPLPAAHFHLGPVTLREALAVLAGPAWRLQVDRAGRQVCFTPLESSVDLASEPAR